MSINKEKQTSARKANYFCGAKGSIAKWSGVVDPPGSSLPANKKVVIFDMIKWIVFIIIGLYPTCVMAQGAREEIDSGFANFLNGFANTDLPLIVEPPDPFFSREINVIESVFIKKYLSDEEFYSVEGFKYGYLIKRMDSLYAVTVLCVFDTSDTWYLVTFSNHGELLDAREISSFLGYRGNLHEKSALIEKGLSIKVIESLRYYSDSYKTMESCGVKKYTFQVGETGEIEQVSPTVEESC